MLTTVVSTKLNKGSESQMIMVAPRNAISFLYDGRVDSTADESVVMFPASGDVIGVIEDAESPSPTISLISLVVIFSPCIENLDCFARIHGALATGLDLLSVATCRAVDNNEEYPDAGLQARRKTSGNIEHPLRFFIIKIM